MPRKFRCREAATACESQRQHQLICQILSGNGRGHQVLSRISDRFFGNTFGWHTQTPECGKHLDDVFAFNLQETMFPGPEESVRFISGRKVFSRKSKGGDAEL
jgi:hypothetical protein